MPDSTNTGWTVLVDVPIRADSPEEAAKIVGEVESDNLMIWWNEYYSEEEYQTVLDAKLLDCIGGETYLLEGGTAYVYSIDMGLLTKYPEQFQITHAVQSVQPDGWLRDSVNIIFLYEDNEKLGKYYYIEMTWFDDYLFNPDGMTSEEFVEKLVQENYYDN